MAGLLNKGYCVITDNFYICPALYKSFLSKKNRRIWDCKIGKEGYAVSTEKGQFEEWWCQIQTFWGTFGHSLGMTNDKSACSRNLPQRKTAMLTYIAFVEIAIVRIAAAFRWRVAGQSMSVAAAPHQNQPLPPTLRTNITGHSVTTSHTHTLDLGWRPSNSSLSTWFAHKGRSFSLCWVVPDRTRSGRSKFLKLLDQSVHVLAGPFDL